MKEKELDEKFQRELKERIKNGIKEDPPCPRCGGKMKAQDSWLFTINECTNCKWNCHDLSDYKL